ncbi:guanylate kinase [bacterium]|nr:guanylate kinase [bacterium]
MKRRGILFVISSPSGGGKTTICQEILEELSELAYSISVTSRRPRPGERDGRDYFFVSEEEFDKKIERDEFAEWAQVHGHRYGTPRQFLEETLNYGRDIILDIDVQGALKIKERYKEACLIFLLPPSFKVLASRLKRRRTDDKTEVELRLRRAREELAFLKHYHHTVFNRELSQAIEEIKSIITAEKTS